MKKMPLKKLHLDRESLRGLNDDQLLLPAGGRMSAQSCGASCANCTSF
ncbi:MAG TPA: hypothetical protein VN999_06390 [Thermoanaerobaculia bacterium]|nr:hypothetical protein [Thermoanaerobaculia bacterium]